MAEEICIPTMEPAIVLEAIGIIKNFLNDGGPTK